MTLPVRMKVIILHRVVLEISSLWILHHGILTSNDIFNLPLVRKVMARVVTQYKDSQISVVGCFN